MKKQTGLVLTFLILGSLCLQGCIPVVVAGAGVAAGSVAGKGVPVKTQIKDTQIKALAVDDLENIPALQNNSNISITVFNRIVLILGQVPTAKLRDQVASKIAKIPDVRLVYNQLTVGPNISFGQFSDDTWITSKVKGNMLGHVNPFAFKVVTENAVVYLLAITTKTEGEAAAKVASRTSGVKRVVKVFEYVQPQPKTTASKAKVKSLDKSPNHG